MKVGNQFVSSELPCVPNYRDLRYRCSADLMSREESCALSITYALSKRPDPTRICKGDFVRAT